MKMSANTSLWLQRFILFILAFALVNVFLMPLVYGIVTSLKSDAQINTPNTPLLPSSQKMFEYQENEYPVVELPLPDGTVKEMALYKKGRQVSSFIDPENPEEKPFEWTGNWRGLKTVWTSDLKWKNYFTAWKQINFLKLLLNTLKYAVISTVGAVFSAALAGYGFSRFEFPGKKILFSIVLATIILPPSVTLIPTYTFFYKIGWVGTWLPVIIPSLFGNGYNIFLLRQFFLGIPRQLDEAARIDGAGPFRIFFSIILPQAVPAITAVSLFHFFYCWNDFFTPLIYLSGQPDKYPISIGLTEFNGLYSMQINLIQATSVISAFIPIFIFIVAQKILMRGINLSGVNK